MADITLSKIDELNVQLNCETHVIYELMPAFTFKPDGYKFMPAYRAGRWNGDICLIDKKKRSIPQGLVPDLLRWAKNNYYSVAVADNLTLHDMPGLEQHLNSASEWCTLTPYDYQIEAARNAMQLNKSLIISPTGSGKSLITHIVVSYIIRHTEDRILITVPTVQLVEQLASDLSGYHKDMEQHIYKISAGVNKDTKKRIVISTWQSVHTMPKPWLEQFDAYICDEAHMADGKSISNIIKNLSKTSKIRIGLTGTLDGTKCHEMQLRGLFGPVIKTRTTKELMDDKTLANLKIRVIINEYKNKPPKLPTYKHEVDYLIGSNGRLNMVVDTALAQKGNTLVLFNYVDAHGKPLYENAIRRAKQYGKEVFYISGETSVDAREEIRRKISEQNNIVLFASYGTFSTGINAPNIHYLILAHPTKSQIRTLQSIGRALRKMSGKTQATLIDIADNLRPDMKTLNYTMKHLVERLKIYDQEKFKYTIEKNLILRE